MVFLWPLCGSFYFAWIDKHGLNYTNSTVMHELVETCILQVHAYGARGQRHGGAGRHLHHHRVMVMVMMRVVTIDGDGAAAADDDGGEDGVMRNLRTNVLFGKRGS